MNARAGRRAGRFVPWLVPGLAAAYLLVAYLVVWFIDVRHVFGGPVRLEAEGLVPPYAWIQLFRQGGLTELFQWGLLGTLVILAAGISARYRAGAGDLAHGARRARSRLWLLVAVVAALMLIEDAGNPRHLFHHYATVVSGGDDRFTTLVEAGYLAAIGSIGVFAVLRYGRYLFSMPRVRLLGSIGAVLYLVAVLMNVTRRTGEWYTAFGGWLAEDLLRAPQMLDAVAIGPLDPTGLDISFFIVDFVIEESLELMGVAFLVGAVVAYLSAPGGASAASRREPGGRRRPEAGLAPPREPASEMPGRALLDDPTQPRSSDRLPAVEGDDTVAEREVPR